MRSNDTSRSATGRRAAVKFKLLERLSLLLNRAIRRDEISHHRLAELGSCSIAFKLRGANKAMIAIVHDGEVSLSHDIEGMPDVQIEGGLSGFVAMAGTQRNGTGLAAGKLSIQGDLATAQNIQSLIAGASFDWEELVAEHTGDVFARQMGRGIRFGLSWLKQSRQVLESDISEFLQYEIRMLASAREIEDFVQGRTAIEADVERLQARVARIRAKRGIV